MSALYDPLLTMDLGDTLGVRFGFLWYPGSLSTSPFPSYGDLPQFGILGMSDSSSLLIATLVSHLVFLLSSTSLFIFLLSSFIVVSLHEQRVFWCTLPVACHYSLMCWSSRFGITHTGVWNYLLGIWAFVSHHFINLSPLAYITVRVVRPP